MESIIQLPDRRVAGTPCLEIGGAGLAAQAIELGLVDELRMFRNPVIVGGGTPSCHPSPTVLVSIRSSAMS